MTIGRRDFLTMASGAIGMASGRSWLGSHSFPPIGDQRVFRVETYGAVGDGIADDTAAIQKAIDDAMAAGGGVVSLARGTYVCDSLTIGHNISIRGAGREVTSLHAVTRSDTTFLKNRDLTTPARNICLEDLEFFLPASGSAARTSVSLRNAGYGTVHRCRFSCSSTASSVGLDLDSTAPAQTYYNVISDNQFLDCASGVRIRNQANCNSIESRNVFLGCAAPVLIDASCNVVVNGNSFQDNPGAICIHLTGGSTCQFNAITFNYFERQGVGVLLDPGVEFNALIANQYSVSRQRYVDNSGAGQLILESNASSFMDVGQIPQLMQVFSRAAGLLQTSDQYDRTLLHVPGTGAGDPGRIFTQLKDAGGANRWVLLARGALAALDVFPEGATSPSVDPKAGPVFRCANSRPTVITALRDGVPGQVVWIVMDAATTLAHGPQLQLVADSDVVGNRRPVVNLVHLGGGDWVDTLRK